MRVLKPIMVGSGFIKRYPDVELADSRHLGQFMIGERLSDGFYCPDCKREIPMFEHREVLMCDCGAVWTHSGMTLSRVVSDLRWKYE